MWEKEPRSFFSKKLTSFSRLVEKDFAAWHKASQFQNPTLNQKSRRRRPNASKKVRFSSSNFYQNNKRSRDNNNSGGNTTKSNPTTHGCSSSVDTSRHLPQKSQENAHVSNVTRSFGRKAESKLWSRRLSCSYKTWYGNWRLKSCKKRISTSFLGHKLRDSFTWNKNETCLTPSEFAKILCDDLELPGHHFIVPITQSIESQLEDHPKTQVNSQVFKCLFMGIFRSSKDLQIKELL